MFLVFKFNVRRVSAFAYICTVLASTHSIFFLEVTIQGWLL